MRRLMLCMSQIMLLLTLAACGGGSGGGATTPNVTTPSPAAAITTNELAGKTVYVATPPPGNAFGTYNAMMFNADGTMTEALNLTSTSLSSASSVLTGTYSIDSNGVLTITLTGKTPETYWKVSSSLDSNGAYDVKSGSVTAKWFFNQTNGASQARSYATGNTIPAPATETAPGYMVTTFAGTAGLSGSTNATGIAARFSNPGDIVNDGTNLYVSDVHNNTIRKIVIATGAVSTFAGTTGVAGTADGIGAAARFNYPSCIYTDGTNLFVSDTNNHTIRKIIIATGAVTTLAGTAGIPGSIDGTGTAARLNYPAGLASDGSNLYLADSSNHTIRKIVIASGQVTTFAGSAGISGSTDSNGTAARFNTPSAITCDGTNLYVTDWKNHLIRKIVIATGAVSTIAGQTGITGASDGIGTAATFKYPNGIVFNGGNLFIAESQFPSGNNTIRKLELATGSVTTIAGAAGISGSTDGVGSDARFYFPRGLTFVGVNIYVTDNGNDTIRMLTPTRSGFVTADFSGKTFYSVNSSGGYQQVVFDANGTVSMSAVVTNGVQPGAVSPAGTWSVTNGTLAITNGQTTTYSYLSDVNTQFLKYWRTQTGSGAKVGWCYDPDPNKSLPQAMALGTFVKLGGPI